MKKTLLILITALVVTLQLNAQVKAADFSKAEVYWYGMDFSHAKMVGSAGFTQPELIRNDYFEKWNSLVIMEADKYNVKEAFRKQDIKIDVEMIKPLNMAVDFTKLVQDKSASLTREDVQRSVKQYKTDQKNGYGIVFVVESFDKLQEKAYIWVTVFDAKTKAVLITERMEGSPRGFGIRNYWAGAVLKVIETIKLVKYKSWFQ